MTVSLPSGISHFSAFTPSRADKKQVKGRLRELLRAMQISEPFSVAELVEQYANYRGISIVLRPRVLPVDSFSAMTLNSNDGKTFHIVYQQETSPPHQDHIIAHELGHIVCGHYQQMAGNAGHETMTPRMEWEAEASARLLMRWSALLQRVIDRSSSVRPGIDIEDYASPLRDRIGWL